MAISGFKNSTINNGFIKYQSTKPHILPVTSTLGYWLDANDAATITESSGLVSSWRDKSGNGVNFSQDTSEKMPSLISDSNTGNQFLRFDGVDDVLKVTNSFFNGEITFTFFWVFKWYTGSSTDYEPIMTTTNTGLSTDNGSFHYVNPSNMGASYPLYVSNTPNAYDGINTYVSGSTYVMDGIAGGGVYTVSRNGAAEGKLTMSSTPGSSANAVIQIAHQSSPTRYAKFDIGEIIVYSSTLSEADKLAVRSYLNKKWRVY
jgi:hypothetical protein